MILDDEDEDDEIETASGTETAGVAIKCYYESDIRTISIPRDVPLRDLRMIIAKTYGLKNGTLPTLSPFLARCVWWMDCCCVVYYKPPLKCSRDTFPRNR
jgi:hypothetical protein